MPMLITGWLCSVNFARAGVHKAAVATRLSYSEETMICVVIPGASVVISVRYAAFGRVCFLCDLNIFKLLFTPIL